MANETTVNRTFKSTVFSMVFEDKRNLLELYNAMTGKHYTDPEQLEINTLENAVYMSMKNDLSFLSIRRPWQLLFCRNFLLLRKKFRIAQTKLDLCLHHL